MRGSRILFVVLLLFSCSKEKSYDNVLVIGHAATGLENISSVYHDNSREALEFALSVDGCNGVELDVQLSSDNELWFYHDPMLDTETDGSGCIPDLTSTELTQLQYKSVNKEKLFSLKELDTNLLVGKHLFLDLRHFNECQGTFVSVDKVIGQLEILGLKDPESFSVHCITGYKQWIAPLIAAGFNVCFSIYNMEEFAFFSNQYTGLEGFVLKNNDFTAGDVSDIQDANKKVFIFEVRSPKGIRRALNKHPDGLLTDDIRATLIEKY